MPLHSSTYGIVYSHEMVTVRKVSADWKLYSCAVEGNESRVWRAGEKF